MSTAISSLAVTLEASIAPFANAFQSAGGSLSNFQTAIDHTIGSLDRLTGKESQAATNTDHLKQSLAGVSGASGGVRAAMGSAGGFIGTLASGIGTILKYAGAIAVYKAAMAAISGVFGTVQDAISLAATLEQNQVAFETMTGSAEKAAALMKQIGTFAAETPFEFPELASSAKKLLAFGTSADQIVPTMRALGDVSSGIGAPLNEIAELFGKAKVQGTLMAEDINQLVGRGIPVIQQFAKQLGVTEGEVKSMASKGQINFSMLQRAISDMTSEGGQFYGMMAKQSTTLGGLWSTLTDNISMTTAGMVQTVVDAFHLKDALAALIEFTGTAGAWIQAAMKQIAPIVLGAGTAVYQAVASTWNTIYGYIAPIVMQIVDVVASNFAGMVATVFGYWNSIYNVIAAVGGAIWSAVSAVASALSDVWTVTMDALGVDTTAAATTTGGAFQTIIDAVKTVYETVSLAFNVLAFGINNFGDIAEAAMVATAYSVVQFGNQVIYFFSDVIPGLLDWFGNNWTKIFMDAANFTGTVFSNLASNAASAFSAIWSALTGGDATFTWTGLTEGFKSTISELPTIAERQVGGVEAALGAASDAMNAKLANGLGQFLADQDAKAAAVEQSVNGTMDAIGKKIKDATAAARAEVESKTGGVQPDAGKMKIDTSEANKKIKETKSNAKDVKNELALAGSAEAMQAQAQVAFDAAKVQTTEAVAAGSTQAVANADRTAGRESAAASKDTKSAALLQQLVVLLTGAKSAADKVAANTAKGQLSLGAANLL